MRELSWPEGRLVEVRHGHLYVLLQQLRAVFQVLNLLLLMLMLMVVLWVVPLLFVAVRVLLLQVVKNCSKACMPHRHKRQPMMQRLSSERPAYGRQSTCTPAPHG
jgi:hypothetical protein